jgi:hypothetical protein
MKQKVTLFLSGNRSVVYKVSSKSGQVLKINRLCTLPEKKIGVLYMPMAGQAMKLLP